MTLADIVVGFCAKVLAPIGKRLAVFLPKGEVRNGITEEIDTRITIMQLVNSFDKIFKSTDTKNSSVETLIDTCNNRDQFEVLWAYEGLGKSLYASKTIPELSDIITNQSKQPALLMLQAGIGLAIAQKYLMTSIFMSNKKLLARLRIIVTENRKIANGVNGGLAGIESMGLVSMMIFGKRFTARVARLANEIDSEVHDLIWHGAGRALYFKPQNFLPVRSAWPTIKNCKSKNLYTSHNLLAGYVWAHTLVNMRSKHASKKFVNTLLGIGYEDTQITEAMAQAIAMRTITMPNDIAIAKFSMQQFKIVNTAVTQAKLIARVNPSKVDRLFMITRQN